MENDALLAIAAGVAALLALPYFRAAPDRWRVRVPLALGLMAFTAAIAMSGFLATPPHAPILAALGAGLLLLTAAFVVDRLSATEGPTGDERRSLLFFWVPLIVYTALLPWSSTARPPDGDEPWYLLVTHSLAHDFDVDLTNNYAQEDSRRFVDRAIEPQPSDPVGPEGQQYSRHSRALPLLLALPYRLAGATGAQLTMAILAAALAYAFLSLADCYFPGRRRECALAYAVFALTPPLLLYSSQVWTEVPAALLLVVGLCCVRLLERESTVLRWLALAGCLLALPLLKLRFGLVAIGLACVTLVALRTSHRRPLALLGVVGAAAVALSLLEPTSLRRLLGVHRLEGLALLPSAPGEFVLGALGPFFDVAFGLFFCAPLWCLVVVGALRPGRRLLRDIVLVAAPYLLVLSTRQEWYGGWSPPFRYGVVLLAPLALLLVPALQRRDRSLSRVLLFFFLGATLVITLLFLAVPGWAYNLANGRSHLLDHASIALGQDVARVFPSYTRPRLASILWPIVLPVLAIFLWGRGRRDSNGSAAAWGVLASLLLVGTGLGSDRSHTDAPARGRVTSHPQERWACRAREVGHRSPSVHRELDPPRVRDPRRSRESGGRASVHSGAPPFHRELPRDSRPSTDRQGRRSGPRHLVAGPAR